MENPATWTQAEWVVSVALRQAEAAREEGRLGLSMARTVTDALRAAGLLPADLPALGVFSMSDAQVGPLADLLDARVRFWVCPDHRGAPHRVEWRDDTAYCLTAGCGFRRRFVESSAEAQPTTKSDLILHIATGQSTAG